MDENLKRALAKADSEARLECFLHGHTWPNSPAANIQCARCGKWASEINYKEEEVRAKLLNVIEQPWCATSGHRFAWVQNERGINQVRCIYCGLYA